MAQSNHAKVTALKAKIATLQTELAAAELAAANEVDPSKVVAGASVDFNYGKAPNVKTLTGLVLGVKVPGEGEKGGQQARVAVGQGFDAQTVTIYVASVTKVHPAVADETPAEDAPAE
jgi:hypothetical protein